MAQRVQKKIIYFRFNKKFSFTLLKTLITPSGARAGALL
jgi:hypothetical protein